MKNKYRLNSNAFEREEEFLIPIIAVVDRKSKMHWHRLLHEWVIRLLWSWQEMLQMSWCGRMETV